MDLVKEAIINDQFCDLLLGKKKFYELDIDRKIHDFSYTYNLIENHIKQSKSQEEINNLFKLIDKSYLNILTKNNVNTSDLLSIIGFVKIYFIWKVDDCLKVEWVISEELKKKIRDKLVDFNQDNSYYIEAINDNLKILRDRFKFEFGE